MDNIRAGIYKFHRVNMSVFGRVGKRSVRAVDLAVKQREIILKKPRKSFLPPFHKHSMIRLKELEGVRLQCCRWIGAHRVEIPAVAREGHVPGSTEVCCVSKSRGIKLEVRKGVLRLRL